MIDAKVKIKKIKISLEDRPGNNLFNLCKKYRLLNDSREISAEDELKYGNALRRALAAIITIMENGHECTYDDIREITLIKGDCRIKLEIHFTRYIKCKLHPHVICVGEFDRLHPMIDPKIVSI